MNEQNGDFIKNGYTVETAMDGSFVVYQGAGARRENIYIALMRGFSDYLDLLAWLAEQHKLLARSNPPLQ